MTAESGSSSCENRGMKPLHILGNILGALWIAGGMLFFLIRFSSIFYHSNKSALDSLLNRLL